MSGDPPGIGAPRPHRGEGGTVAELARSLQARSATSQEVTERCLAQIGERDPSINAFITVLADDARKQARAADRDIAAGRYRGPLHGVPISLKDLIDLRGMPTTAASRVRRGHVAAHDAVVSARLRAAGAVFVGKTNLHEFALGTTNEDSAYGPVHHPLDPTRSPGGSSGGSAAAILADMCYASIGSDTGGSIRIPSAACGLVGLKPAFGEIPLDGVVPLSTTFDHVGPLCRSVEDAAILYQTLAGVSNPAPLKARDLNGLRLGVPRGYLFAVLDPEIAARFDEACDRLTTAGAILDEVAIPHAADAPTIYVHVALPEAAACHAKTLESHPEDYTANVRLRLEMARYILGEDYVRAMRGRDVLISEVNAALHRRDGVLLPTLPVPAVKLGAATVSVGATEEPVRAVTLRLTQPFNITGHPAITMPCGRTQDGLPAGAQLVGMDTLALLSVASAIEKVLQPL
ncbi:MAG TPA: amidase [Vicinamibacterales bacterium]|nr:amidase [Vicinamibacterales bacterium]